MFDWNQFFMAYVVGVVFALACMGIGRLASAVLAWRYPDDNPIYLGSRLVHLKFHGQLCDED